MASGTNGLVSVTYRGEENLWGNISSYIDGLNIYAYNQNLGYISNYGFADGIGTSPYTDIGFTLSKTIGFISAFGYSLECDFTFLASESLGNSSTPVGDNVDQNSSLSSWLLPIGGGRWSISTIAGLYYSGLFRQSAGYLPSS